MQQVDHINMAHTPPSSDSPLVILQLWDHTLWSYYLEYKLPLDPPSTEIIGKHRIILCGYNPRRNRKYDTMMTIYPALCSVVLTRMYWAGAFKAWCACVLRLGWKSNSNRLVLHGWSWVLSPIYLNRSVLVKVLLKSLHLQYIGRISAKKAWNS